MNWVAIRRDDEGRVLHRRAFVGPIDALEAHKLGRKMLPNGGPIIEVVRADKEAECEPGRTQKALNCYRRGGSMSAHDVMWITQRLSMARARARSRLNGRRSAALEGMVRDV